jgi:hypothetical protein
LLKDPSLHKVRIEKNEIIVGDQNCVKTGAQYKIYCKGDNEVGNSTLSAEAGNKRFKQVNTKTNFEREIARFDRPCFFKKPE